LVKICNQLVKKVKKLVSQTGPSLTRSNFCKGTKSNLEEGRKEPKSKKNFGASKCYLGTHFWNLTPKGLTGNPRYGWWTSTLEI